MAESASVIPGVTQWNRLEDRVFAFSCGLRPQAFSDEKGRSDNCCEHPWSDWTRQYRNSQGIQVWLSVGGRINKGCKIMLHPCHKRLLFAYLYHFNNYSACSFVLMFFSSIWEGFQPLHG